jgi:hypothetical protein
MLYYLPGFAAPMATAGLTEYQRISPDLRMRLTSPFSMLPILGKTFAFGRLSKPILAVT